MTKNKDITLEELEQILSHKKIHCHRGEYKSKYIEQINDQSDKRELTKHIKIFENDSIKYPLDSLDDKMRSFIYGSRKEYPEYLKFIPKYNLNDKLIPNDGFVILIQNLNIEIQNENTDLYFDTSKLEPVNRNDKSYVGSIPIIFIRIENCIFKLSHPSQFGAGFNIFTDNGVNLNILSNNFTASVRIILGGGIAQRIFFADNTMENNTLLIEANNKSKNFNNSVKFVRNKSNYPISFRDNIINQVNIDKNIGVEFTGKNIIQKLNIEEPSIIKWNPYQKIYSKKKKEIENHKKLFLRLKEEAIEKGDQFQEKLIRREIAKCNHAEICLESVITSLQERLVLGWSQVISNYGTSWMRAVGCLIFFNLIIALILLKFIPINLLCLPEIILRIGLEEMLKLFVPFIMIKETMIDKNNADIEKIILIILHQAIYAAIIYEIVKSFRIFSVK